MCGDKLLEKLYREFIASSTCFCSMWDKSNKCVLPSPLVPSSSPSSDLNIKKKCRMLYEKP